MFELLQEIIQHIIDSGEATAKDVDIFKNFSPTEPDSCVCVYEYAGTAPGVFTNMSVRSVQITARAKKSNEAKLKLWSIYKSLYAEDSFITLGTRKCIITMRNTPIKIDVDNKGRTIWAFNMGITTNFDY